MASALDMLISLTRSGDDCNHDDADCGGGVGGDGNDSSGDLTQLITSVRQYRWANFGSGIATT